jgi:hypothetical protein
MAMIMGAALAPPLLSAAWQTLTFTTETEIYELKYDDQRVRPEEMKQYVLLSLYYFPDTAIPYFMASEIKFEKGQANFKKWFLSIPIENCNPGYDECKNQRLDDKFFVNAQKNLETSNRQLRELRSMKIPAILEPVRAYLAWTLETTTEMEKARFVYLKTGDPNGLAQVECNICRCQNQEALRQELSQPIEDKAEWARQTWRNRVITCLHAHDPGYPKEAWQSFLKEFGIQETFRPTSPE